MPIFCHRCIQLQISKENSNFAMSKAEQKIYINYGFWRVGGGAKARDVVYICVYLFLSLLLSVHVHYSAVHVLSVFLV